jgi:transketolase C-terminal domain/subunit/transketolase N-terminal domain/subunit
MTFPIDLRAFRPLPLDPGQEALTVEQREILAANVQLCRDTIVFFTATAAAKGLAGHTGGPYDIVPEVLIADGFMRAGRVLPFYFDEAGHRVAIQYLMATLNGDLPAERLVRYREAHSGLPGHPELGFTPGVKFSSGRLGHLWSFVNGVAMAHPDKAVVVFGSDGSQQEGNDAEAARTAVARRLNVKVVVDDNDVTISGHPSQYLPAFSVARTLEGHGIPVDVGDGEDLDQLYRRMAAAVRREGPVGVVNKRKMAVGIPGLEGTHHAHDVIPVDRAVEYLSARGHAEAVRFLQSIEVPKSTVTFRGSSKEKARNRDLFGRIVSDILGRLSPEERLRRVRVFDSDLEGSCGLNHIHKAFPEVFVEGGIMERSNFSAAAGFGMEKGRQGIMGTFSAFLEMVISEITMARLNHANVLAHFSHAGVDEMADNTCHFGVNNMFAANGLVSEDRTTRLYFPADQHQLRAVLERIFDDPGLRFLFTNRASLPDVLGTDGAPLYAADYRFEPGRDDFVREGRAGYVVSFGETLYRALDAVERLREKGLDVGLVNKSTLNVVDEDAIRKVGRTRFVLVAEGFNAATGLGSRFGTWLLERGLTPRYAHVGTHREGSGGLSEQMPHQGLDPDSLMAEIETLAG